jgi:PAS domain S-box-containing protein
MKTHAMVIADSTGTIHVWSPGAEKLFGYAASEAVGQSLDLIVPASYRERHWKGFHKAIASGTSKLDGAASDLPVTCKDGTVVSFPARFIFLRDGRDRAVGAMALFAPRDEE